MLKNVPWASHEGEKIPEGKHAGEGEESLTSTLDAHQCSELTLLIASVTASMRKTLESNFDAAVRRRIGKHQLKLVLTHAGNTLLHSHRRPHLGR